MKTSFQVEVTNFDVLSEIEGAWSSDDYRELLDAMDYDGTAGVDEADLREMCLLSLQDFKPQEAAALVLRQHLNDRLTDGQRMNAATEMLDEKLWEEFADMSLHESMFNVGSLLYAAMPDDFPDPDAVRVSVNVVAQNQLSKDVLSHPIHESFLVRLLADGMGDQSVLHRLFDDQLSGESFPQADNIIWIFRASAPNVHPMAIDVVSSGYWLDALQRTDSYESSAHPDTFIGREEVGLP